MLKRTIFLTISNSLSDTLIETDLSSFSNLRSDISTSISSILYFPLIGIIIGRIFLAPLLSYRLLSIFSDDKYIPSLIFNVSYIYNKTYLPVKSFENKVIDFCI